MANARSHDSVVESHNGGQPRSGQCHDGKPVALVVDDTAATREQISRLLEADGCQTAQAADGEAGFKETERQRVDLIVTDLQMPNIGGQEMIEAFRASDEQHLRTVPVIVCSSTLPDEILLAELRSLGVSGFLPKPIDANSLRCLIAPILEDNKQANSPP